MRRLAANLAGPILAIALLALGTACSGPGRAGADAGNGGWAGSTSTSAARSVAVQEARAAYVSRNGTDVTVTLAGVERTIVFADPAPAVVGIQSVEDFVAQWEPSGQAAVPPIATVVLIDRAGAGVEAEVELHDPVWEATTRSLSYDVALRSPTLPSGAYTHAMFLITSDSA